MRGGPKISYRSGNRPRPVNEAIARPYSHPAPYGGWNARGNLANMPFTDAIVMDNIFPDVQEVRLRKGSSEWATGFTDPVKRLLAYNGPAISKLFASTNTEIYDVTAAGVIGSPVDTCSDGEWSYVNFSTSGGNFLIAANGADPVKSYNGTVWAAPTITGVSSDSLIYVTAHKRRLWFVQRDSMNLWYLPVEQIAGAAVQFPMGALFKQGGKLAAIGSWTLDSGNGSDDLFAILSSEGEIAIYQGTDPASSSTWSLVGIYSLPLPLGDRPFLDYGADLLYLSENGIIPLSQMVQSVVVERNRQISFKIDGAFLDAAAAYSINEGWQMILHKTANFLLVNVPVSPDTLSYQFVMNTITKAWCRFIGWNASSWATISGDLYFGGGLVVYKAWEGLNDNGTPIQGTVIQAYSPLGTRSQKNISLVRPNIGFSGSAQISFSLDADFRTFQGETLFTYAPISTAAIWDVSLWGVGIWDSGSTVLDSSWITVPSELGYLHSFRLQINTSQSTFTWTSTDFAFRSAGIL